MGVIGATFFPHATKVSTQVRHKNKERNFFISILPPQLLFYRFLSVYHNYNLSIKQKILIPTDFSTKHMTTYYYTSSKKLSHPILKNRNWISDILSINSFSLTNIILVRYPVPSGVSFTTLIITSKANA